jgi:hypothetical protein
MEPLESGLVRPRQARYQAALRPDMRDSNSSVLSSFLDRSCRIPVPARQDTPMVYSIR